MDEELDDILCPSSDKVTRNSKVYAKDAIDQSYTPSGVGLEIMSSHSGRQTPVISAPSRIIEDHEMKDLLE